MVRIVGKLDKVVIGQYFLSPFKLSFHVWAENMKRKYGLFSQIFLYCFHFYFPYQSSNNSKGKFLISLQLSVLNSELNTV